MNNLAKYSSSRNVTMLSTSPKSNELATGLYATSPKLNRVFSDRGKPQIVAQLNTVDEFEWTDEDHEQFVECIIKFKGHIPSSRSTTKKWMSIRKSFIAYVRSVRPQLNYNPDWQDLQKAYKLNRKEFTKEFDIKFEDFYHANDFGSLKAKMEDRPWQIKMLEMEADRYQAFVMVPPDEAKNNWKDYCKKRMAEIKVRDKEKRSYYGLGFLISAFEDSFLAFVLISFGLCFIDIILVGAGSLGNLYIQPTMNPTTLPTHAPASVNITFVPSAEPTLGITFHSFNRPPTADAQIFIIAASLVTFIWGYIATVVFFPPDYKWKKVFGKRLQKVIDTLCCCFSQTDTTSKVAPDGTDEYKVRDPYLVHKPDTSHLATNTLHEVTVVPSFRVVMGRMWICLDTQCILELFIYIFAIVFFAYGQYGLSALRVLRVYRYLTYFNYLDVEQDEDIPRERLGFSLVKAAKICGFYMDQLYYEFFTQKSMGGSLVMLLFFFNAYIMAVVMFNQKSYIITGADFVTQPCASLNMCFLTMIRLSVYDGSGLDFVAALLEEGSDGFVFMLMLYVVLNALILFNGLIGIFGNTFTESDETADLTLAEILDMDTKLRLFHEETLKKVDDLHDSLLHLTSRLDHLGDKGNHGGDHDNHGHGNSHGHGHGGDIGGEYTGRSNPSGPDDNPGTRTSRHMTPQKVVTEGPIYRRTSRPRARSSFQSKSRQGSDVSDMLPLPNIFDEPDDESSNQLIQSALDDRAALVDTHESTTIDVTGDAQEDSEIDEDYGSAGRSDGDQLVTSMPEVKSNAPPLKKLFSKLLPPINPVQHTDQTQLKAAIATAMEELNSSVASDSVPSGRNRVGLSLDVSDSAGQSDGKKKLSLLNRLV